MQVATLLVILHSYFIANMPKIGDDAAIVAVLTILLLIGWFRIKDRLKDAETPDTSRSLANA